MAAISAERITGIKPCPFCRIDFELRMWKHGQVVNVSCMRCGASGPTVTIDAVAEISNAKQAEEDAKELAVSKWQSAKGR